MDDATTTDEAIGIIMWRTISRGVYSMFPWDEAGCTLGCILACCDGSNDVSKRKMCYRYRGLPLKIGVLGGGDSSKDRQVSSKTDLGLTLP